MIDLGDAVPLSLTTSEDGTLVDPTTVTLTVRLPDGTTTAATTTRTSLGRYSASYATVQAGRHEIRWVATGPGARAHVDVLNVAAARSTALASLAEFKEHLNLSAELDFGVEDDELRRHLESATGVVERHIGQVVASRSITETHHVAVPGHRFGRVVLRQGPVLSLTSIVSTVEGTVWDPATLTLNTAIGEISPGTATLAGEVTITYLAGYTVVPQHMVLAAQIIAAHLFQLQRVQIGGPSPGFGGEQNLAPSGVGYAVPSRAVELLGGRPPAIA